MNAHILDMLLIPDEIYQCTSRQMENYKVVLGSTQRFESEKNGRASVNSFNSRNITYS